MKLETLAELNAERAARRPVIVVLDTANGEQRLVKARDIAADPLRAELSKQLRMGKSGMVEAGGKKLFLNVYAPTARLVIIGAVHISQALAPLARSLGLRRDGGGSAHGICEPGAISRCAADRGMARCGAAAAQCRSLHGVRRGDA